MKHTASTRRRLHVPPTMPLLTHRSVGMLPLVPIIRRHGTRKTTGGEEAGME